MSGRLPKSFVKGNCPLCSGPQVKIKIGTDGDEYQVFKGLLCAKSPYFSNMFDGVFKEAQNQAAILQKGDGLSEKSFQAFLRWLYTGELKFGCDTPSKNILAATNLSRVGDMWLVSELEPLISKHIKSIMMKAQKEGTRTNIYHISTKIIVSASHLSAGHLVRQTLAEASVESFLLDRNFELFKETQLYPEFAANLIQTINEPLRKIIDSSRSWDKPKSQLVFVDPFSRRRIEMQQFRKHNLLFENYMSRYYFGTPPPNLLRL